MKTIETTPILSDVRVGLQDALDRLAKGIRDPEAARQSRERMDKLREANLRRFGVQNIGVAIIRAMRDSQ